MRRLALLTLAFALLGAVPAQAAEEFALESVEASLSTTVAGAHPDFTTIFETATDPNSNSNNFGLKEPYGTTHDVRIALPPGLLGNLGAVPKCTAAQLATALQGGGCPNASQVGTSTIYAYGLIQVFHEPVYLMEPPADDHTVARLGLTAGLYPTVIEVRVRSESDYGVTASIESASGKARLIKAETTLWGVPADPSHDTERQTVAEAFNGASSSPARPPKIPARPFLTNPTVCGQPSSVVFSVDSYEDVGRFSSLSAPLPPMTGCDEISFAPRLDVTPTSRRAHSPTGLDAVLSLPQDESPYGRATSSLRDSVVTLPRGLTIASGAANGLAACGDAEAHYQLPGAAECPDAAKIGTAEFDVPALESPIHGAVYQRAPAPGHLFRVWLTADEQGVQVKIPGEIEADGASGQLTSVFAETPQVPIRHLRLHFKEGARAPLATPTQCGTYLTTYLLSPWSGGPPVAGRTPMTIDQDCGAPQFSPRLSAGVTNPLAGQFSTFVMNLTRSDGEPNVASLATTLPPGVLAKLAGVGVCAEPAASTGSCPAASRIGGVSTAAGVGESPLWIPQPGKEPTSLFLAGPYKGAPYSLVIVVPAQAGPFDLGTVVTRAGIYVDPETAQVTVKSDPLPQILAGVPISYRAIDVAIDRPSFTLNPTNCAVKSVGAAVESVGGAVATPKARFAVGGCRGLRFSPSFSLSLKGGTRRTSHPALESVLRFSGADQANIARATVVLPPTELIDNAHIQSPCTRVQFNADACPAGSVLGTARAFSPLLDRPLEGPVYFRSNGGARLLPDIVADLHGQIDVVLVGFVDSVPGKGDSSRVRTIFASVPDAPVSRFVLDLHGGKRGLLVNKTNLCSQPVRAGIRFTAQNGRVWRRTPPIRTSCRR